MITATIFTGANEPYDFTNSRALGLVGLYTVSWPWNTPAPVRESQVASPSDMIAIGDNGPILTRGLFRFTLRHQNNANVLFCDGHVESPTGQSLYLDTSDAALARWNRDNKPHRERFK